MEKNIKKIEDMSLNAWPSHKMELYDGWILRFSYFYTHRTNSVEQFGTSTLPWREKVSYCEDVYKRLGSPAVFKISPLVSPDFDYTLENRGYEIQHTTEVMTVHLTDPAPESAYSETSSVLRNPFLTVKYGTFTVCFYRYRQNQKQRRQNYKHNSRNENIENSLPEQRKSFFTKNVVIFPNFFGLHIGRQFFPLNKTH